jgi:dolichol-phosphate mannosyltransferase
VENHIVDGMVGERNAKMALYGSKRDGKTMDEILSIIIPTKNEDYIFTLVDDINSTIKSPHEIIVIDKSDKTPSVNGARVFKQQSDGLGNAVLEGIGYTRGDIIAVMDGDGSHDPKDLANMIRKTNEYEIIIGSRFIVGGRSEDVSGRKWVSLIFAFLTRIILGVNLKDPMTGFIVARRSVFNRIQLNPRGYKFVIETIYKSKASVLEYPITFHARKMGASNVGFNYRGAKEAIRIVKLLISLRSETKTSKIGL